MNFCFDGYNFLNDKQLLLQSISGWFYAVKELFVQSNR